MGVRKVKQKQKQKQKKTTKININIDNSNRATRKKKKQSNTKSLSRPSAPTNTPTQVRPQFTTQVIGGHTTQPLNLSEFMKRIAGFEEQLNQAKVLGNNNINQAVPLANVSRQENLEADGKDEVESPVGPGGPSAEAAVSSAEPRFVERATVSSKAENGYIDTGVDFISKNGVKTPIYVNDRNKHTIYYKTEKGLFKNIAEKKYPEDALKKLKVLLLNKDMYVEKLTKQ